MHKLPCLRRCSKPYGARDDFEKSKVRVLVRGDLQELIGETEGPVCRVETIFILLCIAIVEELEIVKADVTSAYMNTNMPLDSVKHRWVLLEPDVVKVLLQLDEEYWRKYLRKDGKILVELKKLMYGYKEAEHFWKAGYKQSRKDPCLLDKKDLYKVVFVAITVDDCLFVGTRDKGWMEEQVDILKKAFGEVTVEYGYKHQIIGM
jgi:hypothetical protein